MSWFRQKKPETAYWRRVSVDYPDRNGKVYFSHQSPDTTPRKIRWRRDWGATAFVTWDAHGATVSVRSSKPILLSNSGLFFDNRIWPNEPDPKPPIR